MARLKQPSSTASSEPVGPLDQREATRRARAHPSVVEAEQRLRAYLRSRGIERPEDPRWVLAADQITKSPRYRELSRARDEFFAQVRRTLMLGTTAAEGAS